MALVLTMLLSTALCGLYLLLARRWQIVAAPNERSSHAQATPHGGGIGLLLALVVGLSQVGDWNMLWSGVYRWLVIGALALMVLGVLDDLVELSVRLRMALYGLCCLVLATVLLNPLQPMWSLPVFACGVGLVALALLWMINLYNFMDGIDGIAALQCILASVGAALLAWRSGADGAYISFCLLLAASHLGFLVWNWPPARLFMGDAGSVPTGFLLGGLAVLGAVRGYLHPTCWLVLLAVFISDASWTLCRRLFQGEVVTQAHRDHAYQRLSRHWHSHFRVDVLVLLINVLWLFPLAAAIQLWPSHAPIMVILAYLPLLFGVAKAGKFA